MDSPAIVAPSREDRVVTGASELVGGPIGKRALLGQGGFWTPARILIAMVLATCCLGWAQKLPCRNPSNWQHEFQYTRLCYSDVEALYFSEDLVNGKHPYLSHEVEYPVVIGGMMQAASSLAHLFPRGEQAQRFFDMTALLLTVAAIALVLATSATAGRRRPWDAALVALSPALLFHAFTNWDLAAAAFAALGVLAWARRRPVWAGVFLGLGVATKLYPLLFLVPLFFLCLRAGRVRQWATTAVSTVGTAILAYLPILLFTPVYGLDPNNTGRRVVVAPSIWTTLHHHGGWTQVRQALAGVPLIGTSIVGDCTAKNGLLRFFDLNRTRFADFDSLYYAIQHNVGHHFDTGAGVCYSPGTLNAIVGLLVLLVFGLVGLLILAAPRRPRLPQVLFLVVAGFLLVNKVDSPQYVIWLIPLAALARPKWGAFLFWQATEVTVLVLRFMFFTRYSGGDRVGVDFGWFETAVLVRDAALIFLMVLVVREVLRPERDVVRRYGDDDPAGGVLDGAPDRLERRPRAWPATAPA
jgi:uncharacterized membrane protein